MSLRSGWPISRRFTFIPVVSVLVALLSCGLPSVAAAQERTGFWIGFGVGAGSSDVSADNVAGTITGDDRNGGGVADLGVGWSLNHQLLLGFDFNAWTKPSQGTLTVTLFDGLGTLTFYPSRSSGFFIKAGAGMATVQFDIETPETDFFGTVGRGFGLMTGAGYDFRLGRGFSVVPELNFRYGRPGDINLDGVTQFKNWTYNTIDVRTSIVFRRTRN